MGLHANEKKTKFMIVRGAAAPKALDPDQYDEKVIRESKKRRNNITGITKQDKKKERRE